MNVLHIYKDYYPVRGGIENHIKLLAEAQAVRGHQVTVLVTSPTRRTGVDLLNGGTAAGEAADLAYRRDRYHQPADEYDAATWNMEGMARDVTAIARLGEELVRSRDWPNYRATSEFPPDLGRVGGPATLARSPGPPSRSVTRACRWTDPTGSNNLFGTWREDDTNEQRSRT